MPARACIIRVCVRVFIVLLNTSLVHHKRNSMAQLFCSLLYWRLYCLVQSFVCFQLLLLRCAGTTDYQILIVVFVVISVATNCQQLSDFWFLNCTLCMRGATYHCYTP